MAFLKLTEIVRSDNPSKPATTATVIVNTDSVFWMRPAEGFGTRLQFAAGTWLNVRETLEQIEAALVVAAVPPRVVAPVAPGTCDVEGCPDRGKTFDQHSTSNLALPGRHGLDRRLASQRAQLVDARLGTQPA